MPPRLCKFKLGFTLAELLIALAILGVIATFTIPKVLQAQQNASYNAMGKEAAAMISAAYQIHQRNGLANVSTAPSDLFQYMNYIATNNGAPIDGLQGWGGTSPCTPPYSCIRLSNGSVLTADQPTATFGGTATTNAIIFTYDPDGKVTDSTTNGPAKSVRFYLYFNGSIKTWGDMLPGTVNSWNYPGGGPRPDSDPPWFSWN
jgi:prepilin-type N-terminal cleavage/methylation domain-containing protein